MLAGYILALREGLEAALIVGIVLGALRKIRRPELGPVVWVGVGAGVLVSVAAGILLNLLGASFEGSNEQIFEGFTMLLAAGVLTWMIFWMRRQASVLGQSLESDVRLATERGSKASLFVLAFTAVLREGIELALFLTAAAITAGNRSPALGAILGLATVVVLAWGLFSSLLKLDLRKFFLVTGALLVLFAAGLVAHGVHEFNEVGWIPAVIEHVWDINPLLPEDSTLGQILKALLGYNGNPSLTEVIAYLAYLLGVLLGLRSTATRTLVPAES